MVVQQMAEGEREESSTWIHTVVFKWWCVLARSFPTTTWNDVWSTGSRRALQRRMECTRSGCVPTTCSLHAVTIIANKKKEKTTQTQHALQKESRVLHGGEAERMTQKVQERIQKKENSWRKWKEGKKAVSKSQCLCNSCCWSAVNRTLAGVRSEENSKDGSRKIFHHFFSK